MFIGSRKINYHRRKYKSGPKIILNLTGPSYLVLNLTDAVYTKKNDVEAQRIKNYSLLVALIHRAPYLVCCRVHELQKSAQPVNAYNEVF